MIPPDDVSDFFDPYQARRRARLSVVVDYLLIGIFFALCALVGV